MNDLSHQRLTFEALFLRATAEWPAELSLGRQDLGDGRYLIEGLTDIEETINRRCLGRPDEILLSNLNWAIAAAAHEALGRAPSVRPADLAPAARAKFHRDLKSAKSTAGSHSWTAADLSLRDRYLASNA